MNWIWMWLERQAEHAEHSNHIKFEKCELINESDSCNWVDELLEIEVKKELKKQETFFEPNIRISKYNCLGHF